ncbi:MAG: transglycosylase SLT domain-containing protein [Janthinobacterium lividum]
MIITLMLYSTIIINFVFTEATAAVDHEVTESLKCMRMFPHFEKKYSIPADVLHSISLKESGKLHEIYKVKLPWPWAVNVEGRGYYFNNKSEAVSFVKKQIFLGKESIDIGCMQINLKHHPDAFSSLEHGFDPSSNVAYGAEFLKSKYNQLRSWHRAIAYYHSATSNLGYNYKKDIIKIIKNMNNHKNTLRKHVLSSHNDKNHQLVKPSGLTNLNRKEITRKSTSVKKPSDRFFQSRIHSNIMIPVY